MEVNWYVYYGVAILVVVLSAGRLTRLLVADEWPPSIWVRMRWDSLTRDGPWSKGAHCHWCFGPWATLAVGGWGLLSGFNLAWWLANGWLAVSYLVSILVQFDEG